MNPLIEIPRYLIISDQVKNRLTREYMVNPNIGNLIMDSITNHNPEIGKFIGAMMIIPFQKGDILLSGGVSTSGALTYRAIELQAEGYQMKIPRVSGETRNKTIEGLAKPSRMDIVKEMIITNQNLVGLIEEVQTAAEAGGVRDISLIPIAGFGVYLMIRNEVLKQNSH